MDALDIAQVIPTIGQWMQQHPGAALGMAAGIPLTMATLAAITRRGGRREVPDTFGSARWATRWEIKQAGLFANQGIVLGRYQGRFLCHQGEAHVLLCAPTRSGKGVGVIIPTLLSWRESALVLDPKDGENYDVRVRWPVAHGPIYAFTPMRSPQLRINVLTSVRLQTPKEFSDAMVVSESLGAPEKMARENSTSLHFRELANLLRATGILHVLYTKRRKSLAGVWDFFTQAKDLTSVLKEMSSTSHVSGGVHQGIASMTRAIENISGDRELSSVWTTCIRPLVLYSDPEVAKSTDANDLDSEQLQYGSEPIAVYLVAPSPLALERLHPLYRVILDVWMTRLMEHKVRTWQHRLLNLCDELPWYGYTRTTEKGIPIQAGYGMTNVLVVQDLESLTETYGEHSAIWGNCGVKILHAPANDKTAKRICDNLLGQQTVETPVSQQSPVWGVRKSISLGHHGRPLLTGDEFMALPRTQQIIHMVGVKPILADKYDYRFDSRVQRRLLPIP
jgi:type IV secretion system protein VirD4